MIIKCMKDWNKRIFSYIGDDYEKCLYVYSDLIKYGVSTEYVTVWVNVIDDKIRAIIMKYHNGMHIYSSNLDYDKTEIVKLVRKTKPSMVLGVEAIISDISDMLGDYSCKYGYVKKMKKSAGNYKYDDVKTATLEDVGSLTKMLMEDEGFSVGYTYDEMFGQILERIADEYGKTFYIRNEDEICAQLGISAITNQFMIISNVYTLKQYRGKQYASKLFSYMSYISEGKEIYLFCYGDKLSGYYDHIGFETVQLWGKLCVKV